MLARRTFLANCGALVTGLLLPGAGLAHGRGRRQRRCGCCDPCCRVSVINCAVACPMFCYGSSNNIYYYHCKCKVSDTQCANEFDIGSTQIVTAFGCCATPISLSGGYGGCDGQFGTCPVSNLPTALSGSNQFWWSFCRSDTYVGGMDDYLKLGTNPNEQSGYTWTPVGVVKYGSTYAMLYEVCQVQGLWTNVMRIGQEVSPTDLLLGQYLLNVTASGDTPVGWSQKVTTMATKLTGPSGTQYVYNVILRRPPPPTP